MVCLDGAHADSPVDDSSFHISAGRGPLTRIADAVERNIVPGITCAITAREHQAWSFRSERMDESCSMQFSTLHCFMRQIGREWGYPKRAVDVSSC